MTLIVRFHCIGKVVIAVINYKVCFRKYNLISVFKLLAFAFNIILIVCAIVSISSTVFYHVSNFVHFYVTLSDSNCVE